MFREFVGGLYQPIGTVNVELWRRVVPSIVASLLSCWVSAPFEIAKKAYLADQKYPEHLQRKYTSSLNALRRLPFEEGPAFLFKNSLPSMAGTFFESIFLFYFTDYFLDWSRFLHLEYSVPFTPMKALSIGAGIFLSGIVSHPMRKIARNIIEIYPRQNGGEKFLYQYRKAFQNVIGATHYSGNYHGLSKFYWMKGPRFFITLWIAEWMGLFRSWRTNYLVFPGINVFSDIHG
jgi:hypothetical protein